MGYTRDPVSVLFDGPARRLLDRAYASRGQWVQTRLADPGLRARTWAVEHGFDLDGPDNPSVSRARLNARTRWARGFVRALQYQHKWFSQPGGGWRVTRATTPRGNLLIEVGRHVAASPQFDPRDPGAGGFPAGRVVRVQYATSAAIRRYRAQVNAGKKPEMMISEPALRDWDYLEPSG